MNQTNTPSALSVTPASTDMMDDIMKNGDRSAKSNNRKTSSLSDKKNSR